MFELAVPGTIQASSQDGMEGSNAYLLLCTSCAYNVHNTGADAAADQLCLCMFWMRLRGWILPHILPVAEVTVAHLLLL